MIDVFSDICSIFGLGMRIEDKIRAKNTSDEKVIMFLYALADRSESWKNLHLSYHTIGSDVQNIVFYITRHNSGQEKVKLCKDISPNGLKNYFESGTLGHALPKFKSDIQPFISTIQTVVTNYDKRNLDTRVGNIRKQGLHEIAESIEAIIASQKTILAHHHQFSQFLYEVNKHMVEDWTIVHVEYVLKQRRFLRNDYRIIIDSADHILMHYLRLYNYIIREHQRRIAL